MSVATRSEPLPLLSRWKGSGCKGCDAEGWGHNRQRLLKDRALRATAGGDDLAGDGRGLGRCEKGDHVADLLGLDNTANGDVLRDAPLDLLGRDPLLAGLLSIHGAAALRAGGARMHQVHSDAIRPQLVGKGFGEVDDGGVPQPADVARLPS